MNGNVKMTDSELIEELNRGLKPSEIAEKFDMELSSVSERVSDLKSGDRLIRDRLSPTGNAGVQVSFQGSLLEAAWPGDDIPDELYYTREIDEEDGEKVIFFTLNTMEIGNKLQRPTPKSRSRTGTITGKQLKRLGFDDNEQVFAQKFADNNAVKLKLSHERVSEGGDDDMSEDEDEEDVKISSGDEIKDEEDFETDDESPEVMSDKE